ncbi:MAG TPA: LysM peptidoglycan-binding domain-containing protein [Crenotrichaceae bacterium]|nr:LysM peptidoglycan-binding domain-containing protein [Crenotrichaceae bacterium]
MNAKPFAKRSNQYLNSEKNFRFLLCSLLIITFMVSCSQSVSTLKRTPFPHTQTQHIVVKGDTLYSIAYRAGVDIKQLIKWNHIGRPYTLYPGQIINIRAKKSTNKALSHHHKNKQRTHTSKALQPHTSRNNTTSIADKLKNSLKFSWRWPLTGIVVKSFNQTGRKGIDIAGKLGDTILAAASGKVVYSGRGLLGYGNLIIIKHDLHFLTAYANNRNLFVKEGQVVRKGQKIAEVGVLSGKQPSLHFEIRRDGKPVNPLSYLPKH